MQSPKLPRTTKTSSHMMGNSQGQGDSTDHEESSISEEEQD